MIRTREEVLEEINSSVLLADTYNSWSESYQREFIDICTGAKGVKILYISGRTDGMLFCRYAVKTV